MQEQESRTALQPASTHSRLIDYLTDIKLISNYFVNWFFWRKNAPKSLAPASAVWGFAAVLFFLYHYKLNNWIICFLDRWLMSPLANFDGYLSVSPVTTGWGKARSACGWGCRPGNTSLQTAGNDWWGARLHWWRTPCQRSEQTELDPWWERRKGGKKI